MTPQIPAEGILLHKDYGDSKMYHVQCDCTDSEHSHELNVEADDFGVTVFIYTTQTTSFWDESVKPRYDINSVWLQEVHWFWTGLWNGFVTRLRLTRDIWFKGYVKYEASLILQEQSALNYAETLKSAVNDVKEFRNAKSVGKTKTS